MLPYRLLIIFFFLFSLGIPFKGEAVSALQKQLLLIATQMRTQEERKLMFEEKLHALEEERKKKVSMLETQLKMVSSYLSALHKIRLVMPTVSLDASLTPERLIRANLLVHHFVRSIIQSAGTMKEELKAIYALEDSIRKERLATERATEDYKEKYKSIEVLLEEKKRLMSSKMKNNKKAIEKKMNQMAHQSKDIEDLIQHIDQEKAERQSAKIESTSSLQVSGNQYQVRPVGGAIVSSFGDKNSLLNSEGVGVVFKVEPRSLVYSPTNAKVVYAGPFRKYKEILILSHGDGYHTLMMGLTQMEVSVGQMVLAGEPIGYTTSQPHSHLYLELRKKEVPIDPLPWLKKCHK